MRSRPNATKSSVLNSANNVLPDSYSEVINRRSDGGRGAFFQNIWSRCCTKLRLTNHRGVATEGYSGLLCGCYIKEESRPKWLSQFYGFTKSTIWLVLFLIFSIFLMFGPAIQSLVDTGTKGDKGFLYLRTIMLFFFSMDMLLRCVVEENYFTFTFCGKRNLRNSISVVSRSNTNIGDSKESIFRLGSFLFWCDFLSTISILYDLSFINNHHFDICVYELHITRGVLDYETSLFNRLHVNSMEFNLLIVILRTARCARLVQSRAAVDVLNKCNWYQFLRWLDPCFYFHFLKGKRGAQQNVDDNDIENISVVSSATIDDRNQKSKVSLETITLTSQQTRSEKEGREDRQIQKQPGQGLWKKVRFPLVESDEDLTRRREAAIKIQRTWRARVECESDDKWNLGTNSNQFTLSTRPNKKSSLVSFAKNNDDARKDSERIAPKSRFQIEGGKTHNESQVRSDMRQSTGKRVAIGTLLILIFTVLCTYTEQTTTQIKIVAVLHTQTKTLAYIDRSLSAAVSSSAPTLYEYRPAVEVKTYYPNPNVNGTKLTQRNKINITVTEKALDIEGTSYALFDNSSSVKQEAMIDLIATIFIILFWFAGVVSFSGPVEMLVITPVEQMLRLLGMLTLNPLGYQSTLMYKNFLRDEDLMGKNTGWQSEVLKGMETSFLQSNILRIGSLMKVGFGSAGVEIIQNNLETGQKNNTLILNSQGTTVSCIFLFCDIRQFTDATEQLQEEVFVFTNKIAAVVHSICSSYGGAANKNVGDAFLLSWSLDEKGRNTGSGPVKAKSYQADKALLSVIKICIALAYDNFFLKPLSGAAIGRLKTKLKDRSGPVVQMGFGLHAGTAVQGAIGTQRKIDATYVAESVERAEFLESSTKKYKVNMLMSGEFHKLLHSRNRDRCRKLDQILMLGHGNGPSKEKGEFMDLFTFDMDVNALQKNNFPSNESSNEETKSRQTIRNRRKGYGGRKSVYDRDILGDGSNMYTEKERTQSNLNRTELDPLRETDHYHESSMSPELVLPNGPALYSHNVWSSKEIKKIRQKYVQSPYFFESFKAGLDSFYNKEWENAKKHFLDILKNFDDGPSKYFLAQIDKNHGIPPEGFKGYGIVE